MAAAPKKSVTRAREAFVWDLSVRGLSVRQIAAAVNEDGTLGRMTFQAVHVMITRIGERRMERMAEEVKLHKVRQTERLEFITSESLRAWEKSQLAGKERRVKTIVVKARKGVDSIDLPAVEVTRTTRQRDGDPRFLAEARAASADIRKIWGLDAAPTDPPPDQGAADPEVARRALMAAGGEADTTGDDDGDG